MTGTGTARRATGAEVTKLRTLPAVIWTVLITAGATALLAGAFAASPDVSASAADIATRTVRFAQVGVLVVGIWPVAQEYAGRQRCTTLLAVPRRGTLVMAKVAVAAGASLIAAVTSLAAALIIGVVAGADLRIDADNARSLVGAVLYLVRIGLLGHGLALVTRSLTPALVAGLLLTLIVPPLLEQATEHARWLPSSAGELLFESSDRVLGPASGGAVLLAWVVVVTAVGALRLVRRDA